MIERWTQANRTPALALARSLTIWLVLLVGMILPDFASGHAVDQSYIFLRVYDDAIGGRFEATIRDLNQALDLNLPTDVPATKHEIEPHLDEIQSYFLSRASMAVDGIPAQIQFSGFDTYFTDFAQFVALKWDFSGVGGASEYIDVDYTAFFDVDPDHRCLLVVEHHWKSAQFRNEGGVSLSFSPQDHQQRLDLTSSSFLRGFVGLVKLGIHHIWIGIDHILFLFALLLPAVTRRENGRWVMVDSFREAFVRVLKIVTVFTIAHSISLSLAALGVLSFPSRLVEAIIAISIAIAAVDILYPVFRGRIAWVVLAFGFFHGFGFATVLGEIGISSQNMVWALLGFNVGVEIGQAVIVVLAFPVLYLLARTRLYARMLLPAGAAFLVFVSLYWFVERAFAVDLPAGAILQSVMGMVS